MALTSASGFVQKRNCGLLLRCAVSLALGYTTVPVFLVPTNPANTQGLQTRARSATASTPLVDGLAHFSQAPANRQGQTEIHALGVAEKVVAAMSVGAVIVVVQVLLSAVTKSTVNRTLVKRMSVGAAIAVATGYWISPMVATLRPMVATLVPATSSALQSGSSVALLGAVLFLRVLAYFVSLTINKLERMQWHQVEEMLELERASAKKMKQMKNLNEKVPMLSRAA
mmetsp:Transcript_13319/g.29338  ORF Transcript_13319/g.29338 Transcript_13319/m.29338 type:complete len:227 (-) Transcript_13319:252-932(-)